MTTAFTPREIVEQLDRFIVGQTAAKRAVAIALRNRHRRLQLQADLREEVTPKNILMIGPTGCGKTEISRRLARLADAPFLKVEATKFTEIGFVGRDVEQIIRDLMEVAFIQTQERLRKEAIPKAQKAVESRLMATLVGDASSEETQERFRQKLSKGEMDSSIIDIELLEQTTPTMPSFEVPGMPGAQMGMINLGDLFAKNFASERTKVKRMTVAQAREALLLEETDKLLDTESVTREALKNVQENGIVFIDEIDKICARGERIGGEVSREGVQRDLLPLLDGTTVPTKYGLVKTDHILFITSGAFHMAKPSDLLPELQGRLPIRVELSSLTAEDFVRVLTEPQSSLLRQYEALMATEGVRLVFTAGGIEAIARLATEVNQSVENIGARRLQTVLERLLEEISFQGPELEGQTCTIDEPYVQKHVGTLAQNTDLSKFIL